MSIRGLVVEYVVAIDVTRVRFPADALIRRFDILEFFSFEFPSFGFRWRVFRISVAGCQMLCWSSGYDACFTRRRSAVQSRLKGLLRLLSRTQLRLSKSLCPL